MQAVLIVLIVIIYIYASREKNFKVNIRQAGEVRIMSGNTGESILISKEDIEKLADKIDETDFKFVLFSKQRDDWSYRISCKIGIDNWSMAFSGGYAKISYNNDRKSYQYNYNLEEYVGTMYKKLGGK